MADESLLILVAVDVAVFVALGAGLVARRRISVPRIEDPIRAFALLEESVKTSFPELGEGFTWREAVSRAIKARIEADWSEIVSELEKYEAYKYGGAGPPAGSMTGVVNLAAILRARGEIHA